MIRQMCFILLIVSALSADAMTVPDHHVDTVSLNHSGGTPSFTCFFDIDSHEVHPTSGLLDFSALLDSLHSSNRIRSLNITGSASLEGRNSHNRRLAQKRAIALGDYLSNRFTGKIDVRVSSIGEDWNALRMSPRYGELDDYTRSIIADSISDPDLRERKLRLSPAAWNFMASNLFPAQRRATAVVVLRPELLSGVTGTHCMPETLSTSAVSPSTAMTTHGSDGRSPLHLYIKTNLPAWGGLWANVHAEIDVARHWSVTLPVYYSGLNYFSSRRKYRVFALQPEARFWLRTENQGFFVGAHAGICYYNVAFGGDKRYQDHNGDTPAAGCGVSAGYRLSLGGNGRWYLETVLGAGIYRLDYDEFTNCIDGPLLGRRQRTFYGLDNVAVNLCYRFDIDRKKGGGR